MSSSLSKVIFSSQVTKLGFHPKSADPTQMVLPMRCDLLPSATQTDCFGVLNCNTFWVVVLAAEQMGIKHILVEPPIASMLTLGKLRYRLELTHFIALIILCSLVS